MGPLCYNLQSKSMCPYLLVRQNRCTYYVGSTCNVFPFVTFHDIHASNSIFIFPCLLPGLKLVLAHLLSCAFFSLISFCSLKYSADAACTVLRVGQIIHGKASRRATER
ncbi:Os11g0578000 [Oryza sativa Japonica Group]|uniref:Os11g0578000 protein n=1 Tax=Oryza sativa subsp. japonica TaxID=39947 RepID=A0A0P0Y3S5_ORYSJ|nr:Os11g0578000 [Oryza sativa Japonica Group]